MVRIASSLVIATPVSAVWTELSDLTGHTQWMADAARIEILGGPSRGLGTRMEVETVLGPLRTLDVMEVVEWVEGAVIAVRHLGLVQGTGRFALSADDDATRFEWTEELRFPWYLGGAVTGLLTRPILAAVWRRNLARFRRIVESGERPAAAH